ncbi:MAG: histidine kinase [Cyclobacteriaceae bacterium]
MSKISIGNKLALILIGLSVTVAGMLSWLFFIQFDTALQERVLLQLSSVKQLKINKVKTELNDRVSAFKELLSSTDSLSEESSLFSSISVEQEKPTSINDVSVTIQSKSQTGVIQLVDLTQTKGEITIGLVAQIDGSWLIAVSEIPEIQSILLERTGLGQTGESYLVGSDFKLKSRSRFTRKETVSSIQTEGVNNALLGSSGEGLILDYRGKEVFSAYEMIEMNGLQWVLLSEIDRQEALFPLEELKTNTAIIIALMLVFILLVSYFLSRLFVSPLILMEKKLTNMSKGVLQEAGEGGKRKDEIGRMFEALDKLVSALNKTIIYAGEIGQGNFNAEYEPLSDDDKLGNALIQMKQKLRQFQENEEKLIQENQKSIIDGQEHERSRLAKEMHDGIGPMLTTMRINIQSAELDTSKKETLLNRLDETITEVRRISNNLMPSVLEDFGAGEAIGNLINQVRQGFNGTIHYKNDMSAEPKLDEYANVSLYRIAQESINNALKHAVANEIKVSLSEFDDHIGYFIADNGQGFDMQVPKNGNGLRNMKERVKLVNGTFDIHSNASGTTIEIEIPLK